MILFLNFTSLICNDNFLDNNYLLMATNLDVNEDIWRSSNLILYPVIWKYCVLEISYNFYKTKYNIILYTVVTIKSLFYDLLHS